MRTIQEFKAQLTNSEGVNTLIGMHILSLLGKDHNKMNAATHIVEVAIEIFVQMEKNGIDIFKDEFAMGSISKAYYQVKLAEYAEY